MRRRFAVTLAVILTIVSLINALIGWNGRVFLQELFGNVHDGIYWTCIGVLAFAYFFARFAHRILPGPLAIVLKLAGSYWLVVVLYGLLLLPIVDVLAVLLAVGGVDKSVYVPVLGWAFLAVLLAILIKGSYNAWSPIVRRYEFTVSKPVPGRRTLRVAVASDLHLGTVVRKKHLQRLVRQAAALKPDLILLPGDIIDDEIAPFIRQNMAETMRGLQAPLGVYASLGNHEYIGGHVETFHEQMTLSGVRLLMDEAVCVEDAFYIVGRKDAAASGFADGRKELAELLAGLDPSKPIIVLDHQPRQYDKAVAAGVDVLLSGHTHRGQMAPGNLITRRLFELDWGYLRKKQLNAVVSSGFGSWGPPVRIGSRCEIVELVIHFESHS
ncbi:metallophosphoesterase [Paenibacillus athensensis]|uniref:Phosphoesterase n=1 Tax=Paenibacillus athensensis TaxID=1967502 RepID=A0A4Y8PY51_9BACL|nr:metallophosphoesterase [Paenibacillus athensensis]MCD1257882.1 metallophosphoesterase [Paenibacillus athensensis]